MTLVPHKLLFSFLLFILVFTKFHGQTINWQNTIGGTKNEWLSSIEKTRDGNYILGGYSGSSNSREKTDYLRGGNDYWFVKVDDSSGNILWQKTIGGNWLDRLTSIAELSNGDYILGGYSSSRNGYDKTGSLRGIDDYWVVRLDPNGNILWDKTYGGTGTDRLWSIIETDNGELLMAGESDSNASGEKSENSRGINDFWIIKTTSSGDIIWDKTFGGADRDYAKAITKSYDNNYIIVGSSMSNISGEKTENSRGFGGDFWLLKINDSGDLIWQKTYGGDNGDYAYSIEQTLDNNYYIGGTSASNISGEKKENSICNSVDFWVLKIDERGNIIWDKTIGGNSTEQEVKIRTTKENGVVIGGASYSDISGHKSENSRGKNDYWIVKLDENGIVEWDKTFGGDDTDTLNSLVQNKEGDYVLAGWSTSNISGEKKQQSRGGWDYWFLKFKEPNKNNPTTNTISSNHCIGSSFSIDPGDGTSFEWTGPNNFTQTKRELKISNFRIEHEGIYNVTIYDDSGCTTTKVYNLMPISFEKIGPIDDVYECDKNSDGFTKFNLDTTRNKIITAYPDLTVKFYHENGQLINSGLIENSIIYQEKITVILEDQNTGCSVSKYFNLIANAYPETPNISEIIGCDEDNNGFSNFFSTINLSQQILQNQTHKTVSFYNSNGDVLPNPLPSLLSNITPNIDHLLYRVTDTLTTCFKEGSIVLKTSSSPKINQPRNKVTCEIEEGIGIFNLSNIENEIIGSQSHLIVEFSDINGILIPDLISSQFRNFIEYNQTIFVKVMDDTNQSCYSETQFDLIVASIPEIDLLNEYSICFEEEFLNIIEPSSFDNYSWTNANGDLISNTNSVNLFEEGLYYLTATKIDEGINCEKQHVLELKRSKPPRVKNVVYSTLNKLKSIEILAEGEGTFEYSIDGFNYYNSNIFENLEGGSYNVFVRDINGCGIDSQRISFVNYPNFFTPNQDFINDTWHIYGVKNFPKARVLIYDRFGKIVKSLGSHETGWDGIYNGVVLPSSDYWFVCELNDKDNIVFKGHFSLKR